jgi:hypothetical protein
MKVKRFNVGLGKRAEASGMWPLLCSQPTCARFAMTKFRITYAIAGRTGRRELVTELPPWEATTRAIAKSILQREFSEVDAPSGIYGGFTPEQALTKFAITDIRTSVITDSEAGKGFRPLT